MEKIRPDIFRMEGRKSRHQFQINRENLINGPNSRCNHGGVSPLNHVPAKPPFHPEKGGCLQGVCIPVGFSLLVHYYDSYRRKTAVKGEFPFRPRRAKKEFLI
jgi:hypothetical protein